MPCNRCGSEFGFFRKEHACKACGFAFCNSCLKKKMIVPKYKEDKPVKVCNKCFDTVSNNSPKKEVDRSPPAALKKLEKKNSAVNSNASPNTTKKITKDEEIANRLQALRKDQGNYVPSLNEIQDKFAKLKGVNPDAYFSRQANTAPAPMPPKPSTFEETQQLFERVSKEVKMESQLPNPDKEIADRLKKLRETETPNDNSDINDKTDVEPDEKSKEEPPPVIPDNTEDAMLNACSMSANDIKKPESSEPPDEQDVKNILDESKAMLKGATSQQLNDLADIEAEVDKVLQQVLEEAKLEEEKAKASKYLENRNDESDSESLTEFPWCEICNEDASLRCYGCNGDLYCAKCFRECHDEFEIRDHQSVPYKPPQKDSK